MGQRWPLFVGCSPPQPSSSGGREATALTAGCFHCRAVWHPGANMSYQWEGSIHRISCLPFGFSALSCSSLHNGMGGEAGLAPRGPPQRLPINRGPKNSPALQRSASSSRLGFAMQATLLGILGLALLGTLHAQDSIPVQADFQQDKLTGRWYSIGLASNSNWFKEKRHLMKMCTTIISTTTEGNLEVTSTYPKGDQCVTRNSLYTKTEQPGQFSYTSPRWGSKHNIHVVETNYEEYALVATQISKSTGSSTMVLLYSRTKELSPERLEMFTQFSREQGLTDDEILILPQTDKCMADAA